MGGMAALIPIKNDPEANEKAMNNVRTDKLREVKAGHDGTWVAHPGLIPIAMEVFNEHMKGPNQVSPDTKIVTSKLTSSTMSEMNRSQSPTRQSTIPLARVRSPSRVSETTSKREWKSDCDHQCVEVQRSVLLRRLDLWQRLRPHQ